MTLTFDGPSHAIPPHITLDVPVACRHCGDTVGLHCSLRGLIRHTEGMLIQRALPELTPDEREILLSGICGACFDRFWKNPE